MGLFRISDAEDWELEHEDQDIRGWSVVDAQGNTVGTVDDLIASTETERVETIVLSDGRDIPAEEVEISDGVVYLEGVEELETVGTTPVVEVYEDARVRRRPA